MNRPLLQTLAIVVTAVTALPSAAGQQTTPPAASSVPEPHMCRFGAAVNVSTFGPPRLMTGIGTSQIRITTRVPAAQQFFNQGLNLLHGFWDTEAYRAF